MILILELKIQTLGSLDKHFVVIKWFAAEQGDEWNLGFMFNNNWNSLEKLFEETQSSSE